MRAVVDTNVLVSGLIRPQGPPGQVVLAIRQRRLTPILTKAILDELVDVLARPWLRDKYGLRTPLVRTFIALLLLRGEIVEPRQTVRACGDPRDDKFLEAALAAGVVLVISGDRALLALSPFEGVRILSPRTWATEDKAHRRGRPRIDRSTTAK